MKIDDLLKDSPQRVPWRPAIGIAPKITDAELLTLSVMAALSRYTSETRWLRYARKHLSHLFPYLPGQPGYNKRLRKLLATPNWLIGVLARDTSLWSDDVWLVDSTPYEALTWPDGPSTGTAHRIHATSGVCVCTWSPPCTACRSRSP